MPFEFVANLPRRPLRRITNADLTLHNVLGDAIGTSSEF
jgi:hypothetical protein